MTANIREALFKAFLFSIMIGSLFCMNPIYAATVPTLDQVIINISNNLQNLMRLTTAIAYLFGIYFIVTGIMEFKHTGESRTMMSQEHHIKKPLIFMAVGAALIYLPSSINAGLNTFFNSPVPYEYPVDDANPWSQLIKACFIILQLVGVISFIRGLIILTGLGGHNAQQGTFARGLTHIIGGILCINMYDTIMVILNTLGLSNMLS